tara:strand:- start:314 stop:1009 length:696 start_codon:yes stop_codon:yes gene_type:complete
MKNVLHKLPKNKENVKAIDLEIKKKIEQIKEIENDIKMKDTVLVSLKKIYKEPRIVEGRKNNIDKPIDCQAEIVKVLMKASIPPDHRSIISYLMTFKCYNEPVFKYLLHNYKYNRGDTPLEETVPGSIVQEALMGYTLYKDSLECMGPEEIPEKTVDLKDEYEIVTDWLDKEEEVAGTNLQPDSATSAADGSSPPKEKGTEGAEAAGVAAKKEGAEHVAAEKAAEAEADGA